MKHENVMQLQFFSDRYSLSNLFYPCKNKTKNYKDAVFFFYYKILLNVTLKR